MGSNKSNTNSSMGSAWRAVQNGKNASAFGNDEDDASGMAWVKKRRAARERAKLEADQAQSQPGDADVETPQLEVTEEEVQETSLPDEDKIPQPLAETPTVASTGPPHEKPEHITTAINLPPQRTHKREPSFGHRVPIPQPESPIKEKPSFVADVFDMDMAERPEVAPGVPEPSADSTSEDEDDEESSVDEDDEDESDVYSEVRACLFSVYAPPN